MNDLLFPLNGSGGSCATDRGLKAVFTILVASSFRVQRFPTRFSNPINKIKSKEITAKYRKLRRNLQTTALTGKISLFRPQNEPNGIRCIELDPVNRYNKGI